MSQRWMTVNLLPPQPVTQRFAFSIHAVGIGFLAVTTVTLSALGWTAYTSNVRSSTMLDQVTSQQQEQEREIQTLQAQVNAARAANQVDQAAGSGVDIQDLVKSIDNVVPSGTSIQSVSYTTDGVDLVGTTKNYSDCAQLEDSLTKLPNVAAVWVNNVSGTANQFAFTLRLALKEGTKS